MERIIRDKIVEHMEENNLFTIHQHGFRKGHSCITQLIEVLDEWTETLDQSDCIDVIFLDFKKAFDTVPHERLITKLQGYKIEGNVLNWVKMFLNNRQTASSSKWGDFEMVICGKRNPTRKRPRSSTISSIYKRYS